MYINCMLVSYLPMVFEHAGQRALYQTFYYKIISYFVCIISLLSDECSITVCTDLLIVVGDSSHGNESIQNAGIHFYNIPYWWIYIIITPTREMLHEFCFWNHFHWLLSKECAVPEKWVTLMCSTAFTRQNTRTKVTMAIQFDRFVSVLILIMLIHTLSSILRIFIFL